MSGWAIGSALALAQLQATLERINAAPGPAVIRLYTSALPADAEAVADPGGHQVEIKLASPAGAVTAGVLKLAPLADDAPMVLALGMPRWGLLIAGDGAALARGKVTDAAGSGEIRISGGTTAEGDDSPTLYPGGLVGLVETFLT